MKHHSDWSWIEPKKIEEIEIFEPPIKPLITPLTHEDLEVLRFHLSEAQKILDKFGGQTK